MVMDPNDKLLKAIRGRSRKSAEFNYGIITADRYVKTLQDAIGLDRCYRFLAKGTTSFDDLMTKAARTLVYSNPDMELQGIDFKSEGGSIAGLELPKNTLMSFRHVLTSSRKDRDGDVLHSDGASVDPKMLLLWQHVHTMPIGKAVKVAEQNSNRLVMVSAIVDMNEVCHDSAVMIDNGMGRFSHGFRAIDFAEVKDDKEGVGETGGFDVKRFEILEESLVSVPANPDAETEEVLLSLVEGGKLTSTLMKEFGRGIRSRRPVAVSVPIELKVTVDVQNKTKENGDENKSGSRKAEGAEGGGASTPKETDGKPTGGEEEEANDEKVTCPGCGEEVVPDSDGKCPECGAKIESAKNNDKSVKGSKGIYGTMRGSWQWVIEELSKQSTEFLKGQGTPIPLENTYCSVMSLFSDYGVISLNNWQDNLEKYFRASWNKQIEKPRWSGSAKEIELTIEEKKAWAGSKTGRVLSTRHEKAIRTAKEHVDDVAAEEYIKRGHGAQLREASVKLGEVLAAATVAQPDAEGDSGNRLSVYTTQTAMAHFLATATANERRKLLAILNTFEEVEKTSRIAEEYATLLSGKAKESVEDDDAEEEETGPKPFRGDLHKETHKGATFFDGKTIEAYLVKECQAQGVKANKESATWDLEGKGVSAFMVKAGWEHTYFQEEDDKAEGKRRVEAFYTKGMKATAIHFVGKKGTELFISKPNEEPKE
jgi:hypothetical protein